MSRDDCESRDITVLAKISDYGRSRVIFNCPFCTNKVTAYMWSLCGGGKRCDCGAIFGSGGTGYRLKEKLKAPKEQS